MSQYKIAELFISINGEGVLAGQLAVFIRFHGCNLNCSYCDTAWANDKNSAYTVMNEKQIYHYIKETGIKNVTLTGGEPLLNSNILLLLQELTADNNLHVEIETNGSIDLSVYAQLSNPPVFTMDYKLPGSQMESKMRMSNFLLLQKKDTVKFVVGDRKDLDCAKEIITRFQLISKCHVYISTVFGKINLEEVVDYMKINTLNGVTLQLQLHKFIWDANKRGV